MNLELSNVVAQIPSVAHGLLILTVAGLLGAALGVVRPVRTGIVPRSAHVIQAQILSPSSAPSSSSSSAKTSPVHLRLSVRRAWSGTGRGWRMSRTRV